MTQATAEGTTFSWLTGLLAEANEKVSEEEFKKYLEQMDTVSDGEKVYELPREIAALMVYAVKLMTNLEKQGRRHIADHFMGLDEDDDHQCSDFHTAMTWDLRKAQALKNLFWLGVWEHLGKPSKNFSIGKNGNGMVVVEYKEKNDAGENIGDDFIRDLFHGGALVVEGGFDLLSKLLRR